jgi:lipoprotein-releasing system permease protein
MKLENLIATRYLRSRRKNRIFSFISTISVIGIMVGVATLIIVINVMIGFSDNLQKKILGANAHIIVNRLDASPITDWQLIDAKLRITDEVTGVSPFILSQVLLTSSNNVSGVIVRGVVPKKELGVTSIEKFMKDGEFLDIADDNGTPKVVLGKELARSLGVIAGDDVIMVSPFGKKGPFGITPKMMHFTVAGYFDMGMYEYNSSLAYISLKTAQDFFNTGDTVSGFSVKTSNFADAVPIAKHIQDDLGFPYWSRDWISMNSSLFSALKLEKIAMFIILTLIIIVASFNIVSMITVSVKDKKRDIAILRAMGAPEKSIYRIFMRQGLTVGFVGTVLGNVIGYAICFLLKNYKLISLPEDIYFMDRIPVKIEPSVFLTVTACAIVITYIAGLFPARQSAKLDPIEALRRD